MSLRGITERCRRFFFEPQGVESIAIFRVVIGALVVLWCLLLIPDYLSFYGSQGALTWKGVRESEQPLSFWMLLGRSDEAALTIWGLAVASGATLAIGFWTRLSACIAFVALTSLAWRNPYVLNSGDTLLRMFLLYLAGSPAGWAFSLDEKRRRQRGQPSPSQAEPWALRLIQLQLSWVYLVSFWLKFGGADWIDGTAVYYVLRIEAFQRFPVPEWIAQSLILCRLLSWGTLAIEFAMGLLVWIRELRAVVLLLGVMLHLSIEYSMNIPIFELVTLAGYIAFVPSETWRRWMSRIQTRIKTGNPEASGVAAGKSN